MHATVITKFTTNEQNEDILRNAAIRAKIIEVLGVNESTYYNLLSKKGFKIDFTIFFNGENKVSINNKSFHDIIEDAVYISGRPVHASSIRIENATTATIMFTIS